MIRGGCLCGGIRFEISGDLWDMCYCHCQMCRRAHGTPFGNFVAANPRDRQYTEGEELIARYQSSADGSRTFCSRCGSRLEFQNSRAPEETWIAVGTFDDDPGIRSTSHIWVDSKAPWYEITDDLKQHPEEPEE